LTDTADSFSNETRWLAGENLEGKVYVFEPNSQDQLVGYPAVGDPNGRPIKVKVVRNRSGVNLKPARLAHCDEGTTPTVNGSTVGPFKLGTGVDGYCHALADRPAGIIDEFLPPGGVPPWDLFYVVTEGPTKAVNQHAAPSPRRSAASSFPPRPGRLAPMTWRAEWPCRISPGRPRPLAPTSRTGSATPTRSTARPTRYSASCFATSTNVSLQVGTLWGRGDSSSRPLLFCPGPFHSPPLPALQLLSARKSRKPRLG
jgi:hypothetical protein